MHRFSQTDKSLHKGYNMMGGDEEADGMENARVKFSGQVSQP